MNKKKIYKVDEIKDFRELLNRTVSKYPKKIAYKYKKQIQDTKHISITYEEFNKDIKSLSTMLLELGLYGKKIAVIGNNRYEWCVSYLAITTAGMIVVPLDKALPPNEIETLLKRSEAEAVIFDKKYELELKKRKQNTKLRYLICMDTLECGENCYYYGDILKKGRNLLENGNNKYEKICLKHEDLSVLLFTSGTTSEPKAVMLSQYNICSNIYSLASYVKMYPKDTLLSFLPIHHTLESTITFLYGIYYGVTVAFCDGLKYIPQNLKEYGVTIFVAVPLVLENIYKKLQKGIEESGKKKFVDKMIKLTQQLLCWKIDIRKLVFKKVLAKLDKNLRVIFYGAAPMDKNTIIGYNQFGIDLIQGYGMTETSPVIATETDYQKRPGSVGFPLPNIKVKIEKPNEQEVGEILVKGPNVMLGYYKNEEETNKVLKNGWLYTGDYGYFDRDGFLYITGRKKDVIVLSNGKNIYPQELEFLLNQIPGVEESLVFNRQKGITDTTLCAKIVYQDEQMKILYPNEKESNYKEIIWKQVKEMNQNLPNVKHIKQIIVTNKPMAKTTTQKLKRYEEIEKIQNSIYN